MFIGFGDHDIYSHIEDCLMIIARWVPEIFNKRGIEVIKSMSSSLNFDPHGDAVLFSYPSETNYSDFIYLRRFRRNLPKGQINHLKEIYEFALNHTGIGIDDLMKEFIVDDSTNGRF